MKEKYQVFVTLKESSKYGKTYNPNSMFHGVPKKLNGFDSKEEAIKEAKEFWNKDINKIYVRKVVYYEFEEVE